MSWERWVFTQLLATVERIELGSLVSWRFALVWLRSRCIAGMDRTKRSDVTRLPYWCDTFFFSRINATYAHFWLFKSITMENSKCCFIAQVDVYRNASNQTHTPMFIWWKYVSWWNVNYYNKFCWFRSLLWRRSWKCVHPSVHARSGAFGRLTWKPRWQMKR